MVLTKCRPCWLVLALGLCTHERGVNVWQVESGSNLRGGAKLIDGGLLQTAVISAHDLCQQKGLLLLDLLEFLLQLTVFLHLLIQHESHLVNLIQNIRLLNGIIPCP